MDVGASTRFKLLLVPACRCVNPGNVQNADKKVQNPSIFVRRKFYDSQRDRSRRLEVHSSLRNDNNEHTCPSFLERGKKKVLVNAFAVISNPLKRQRGRRAHLPPILRSTIAQQYFSMCIAVMRGGLCKITVCRCRGFQDCGIVCGKTM